MNIKYSMNVKYIYPLFVFFFMTLTEWTLTFIKHMDVIKQHVASIVVSGSIISVMEKNNKKQDYFVLPRLDNLFNLFSAAAKSDIDQNYAVFLVCANTIDNFKVLIQNWVKFASHQRLTIYFVNPVSNTDTKWVIKPWLHNKISDPESLEVGLKAIFDMVEEVHDTPHSL